MLSVWVTVVLLSVYDLWLWLALSAVLGYGAVRMGMVEKSVPTVRCFLLHAGALRVVGHALLVGPVDSWNARSYCCL